jgi:hypothetical protein
MILRRQTLSKNGYAFKERKMEENSELCTFFEKLKVRKALNQL